MNGSASPYGKVNTVWFKYLEGGTINKVLHDQIVNRPEFKNVDHVVVVKSAMGYGGNGVFFFR